MILFLILKNGISLQPEQFSSRVKPVVFKAFTLPDRAIRITLLNALPDMIENITNYEVQDKIFPNLIQGFNDTNGSIREETLKAVMTISDKISDRQLNNDLLRYLAKLQSDQVAEIRTNTVLCLTKIATHMNSNSRTTVLVTAFSKALKDPFVPLRLKTIVAFETCIDYFSPEICCSRVLSALAPALLDKSSKVRIEAEKTYNMYMKKIHDKAATLPVDDESTMEEQAEQGNTIEDSFATLSLSKLGFGPKNSIFGFGGAENGVNNDSSASLTMKNTSSSPPVTQDKPSGLGAVQRTGSITPQVEEEELDFDDDGWGFADDDADEEVVKPKPKPLAKKASSFKKSSVSGRASSTNSTAKHGLKLAPKSSGLKLDIAVDEDDDGWGDGW
ncbi:unnamed protein product [Ambrosiozyma monospora]|uniref:Unnamed protein product n=1 Tax=Ambrosiozyma monospora TaxID=43982 RepID=A0A9W6SXD9_AMBMO|nr:unnamed protein product [Ambrosiozyma monospora]